MLGLYWDNGKEMETTIKRYILGVYWGYMGIVEKWKLL